MNQVSARARSNAATSPFSPGITKRFAMVALVLDYLLVQSNLIPLVRDAYMGSGSAHFRAAFEVKFSQYSSRYGMLGQAWGE